MPTWKHPLFGADPLTLVRALARGGSLPPRAWALVGALLAVSCVRAPFSLCEYLWVASTSRRIPAPRAPVIILGHWRCGTTHLFNLMSRDPRFAWSGPLAVGIPWDYKLIGNLLEPVFRRLIPGDRYVDAVAVTPESPQEDEIALASMQDLSYYHGIYFPRCLASRFREGVIPADTGGRWERRRRRLEHFHRKLLAGRNPSTTLLIKNPVYTGQVGWIRRIWPDARFIHIYRNPYDVFVSTRGFFRDMLSRFALQDFDVDVIDDLILDTYPGMIERLYDDTRNTPRNHFVELRFEDLESDPLAQLERIYTSLELDGFDDLRDELQDYLDSIKDYEKRAHVLDEETVRKVDRYWGGLVETWGYERPR
jgi:hypothetical protein